jgi:hypothetical protein
LWNPEFSFFCEAGVRADDWLDLNPKNERADLAFYCLPITSFSLPVHLPPTNPRLDHRYRLTSRIDFDPI